MMILSDHPPACMAAVHRAARLPAQGRARQAIPESSLMALPRKVDSVGHPSVAVRRTARAAVILAAALAPCAARAAPSSSVDPLPGEVAALLPLLADPSRELRELATKRITSLGPGVLPLLEDAEAAAGGEAAWRLRGIRHRLQQEAVAEAVEPTRVAASGPDMPFTEACAAVFASRGGAIPLAGGLQTADRPVDPMPLQPLATGSAFGTTTYWEEVEALLVRGDFRLTSDQAAPGQLLMRPREPEDPATRSAACGPLWVELLRLQPVPADAPRGLRGMLRVVWEPRMEPVMVRLPMASLIAEGPGGEVVPPQQRASVVEGNVRPRVGWVDLPVLLKPAPPAVDRLATLRGTVEIWLPAAESDVHFQLDEVGRLPIVRRLGEATVQLDAVTFAVQEELRGESGLRRRGRLTVRMTASYPASEALQSHHTWITLRPIRCEIGDASVDGEDQRVVRRDDRGLTREAVFLVPLADAAPGEAKGADLLPRGLRVSWGLPLAVRRTRIDVRFANIPLPFPAEARP